MTRFPLVAAALAALALTGCGDRLYPVHGTVTLDDGTPVTRGMIVCERIDGGPALSAQGEIKPDGTITLTLNQTFKAAGVTRAQLEKDIRERYVPRYYKQMTVGIKLTRDTRFYYVGGEVRAPGRQLYLGRITILKAIQSAGDFNDFAQKKKVELTRSGASKLVIVNCAKAMHDSSLDVEIYPGDKIHVPRRFW